MNASVSSLISRQPGRRPIAYAVVDLPASVGPVKAMTSFVPEGPAALA